MASMIHLYNDQILLPCTSKWNVDLESGLDQIQGLEQKGGACSTTTPSNKRFYNWRLKKYKYRHYKLLHLMWPLIGEKNINTWFTYNTRPQELKRNLPDPYC